MRRFSISPSCVNWSLKRIAAKYHCSIATACLRRMELQIQTKEVEMNQPRDMILPDQNGTMRTMTCIAIYPLDDAGVAACDKRRFLAYRKPVHLLKQGDELRLYRDSGEVVGRRLSRRITA